MSILIEIAEKVLLRAFEVFFSHPVATESKFIKLLFFGLPFAVLISRVCNKNTLKSLGSSNRCFPWGRRLIRSNWSCFRRLLNSQRSGKIKSLLYARKEKTITAKQLSSDVTNSYMEWNLIPIRIDIAYRAKKRVKLLFWRLGEKMSV